MGEFDLIQRYCLNLGVKDDSVRVGVGDDAAVIDVPSGHSLLVSTDTMNVDQHFYPDVAPGALAHKLVHSNVSDIASMGGQPKWATLALSMPEIQEQWLYEFTQELDQQAKLLGFSLVGGDTTKGSLSLSLTIMGIVKNGKSLTRDGACLGDLVCVSGSLGGAALGLLLLKQHRSDTVHDRPISFRSDNRQKLLTDEQQNEALDCLHRPHAQVALGQSLQGYASSCIDLSDGLAGDLHHVLRASKLSARLDWNKIPIHPSLMSLHQAHPDTVSLKTIKSLVLAGGEDYQLAFTISPSSLSKWGKHYPELYRHTTVVGEIVNDILEVHASGEQANSKRQPQSVALELCDGDTRELLGPYAYQHFQYCSLFSHWKTLSAFDSIAQRGLIQALKADILNHHTALGLLL